MGAYHHKFRGVWGKRPLPPFQHRSNVQGGGEGRWAYTMNLTAQGKSGYLCKKYTMYVMQLRPHPTITSVCIIKKQAEVFTKIADIDIS